MGSKAPDTSKASKITADASIEAARLQAASEAENRSLQERLYGQQVQYLQDQESYNRGITQQNQANYQPYINQGQNALGSLAGAVNDPNSWLNKSYTGQDLEQDSGYQFRLNQGQNALNASLASKGGLLSGAAQKAISNYNQGFASNEFSNGYQRYTNDRNNRYTSLANLANVGLSGAQGFAGGSAQSALGNNLSNISSQYGNNLGNIIQNGANAQSQTILSNANAQAQLAMAGQNGAGGAGFLGGAASGAAIGTSIMPGWGTAIGAGIGGLASLL